MTGPLHGIRVLSLCVGAVMPELTRLLAEFGADVVKVESRTNPDFLRMVGAVDVDASAAFNEENRNKKSFAADLKTEEGRAIVRRLAAEADIIGENYRGDVTRSWGLDYESVRGFNPSVVYISSQGFGRGGPSEMFPAYGPNLAAAIGHTYLWSQASDPTPIGGALNHPDHIAGKQAAIVVLAALDHRRRTGQGEFIDLSQAEAGAHMMGERYLEWTYNGLQPPRLGNRNPAAAPQGVYPALGNDRWCVISATTDAEWRALATAIGRPDLAADDRLATLAGRHAHHDEIDRGIETWTAALPPAEVADRLQSVGVPAGWVTNVRELVADEHLAARGSVVEIDHPATGPQLYLTNAVARLSRTPVLPAARPPVLGEHTDEICRSWLGLTEAEIIALRERGSIGN